MKSFFKFIFSRFVFVSFLLLLQILLLVAFVLSWQFNEWFSYFYTIINLMGWFFVVKVICDKSNPSYKIAWIIVILIIPVFGTLFYCIFGRNSLSRHSRKKLVGMEARMKSELAKYDDINNLIKSENKDAANQSRYITDFAYCPPYIKTETEYLPSGEAKWVKMLDELKKAEKFIFLEYFIIEDGRMWSSILEILEEKAALGVDVRLIYDDLGCIQILPNKYYKTLEKKGIKTRVFSPYVPLLISRLNNRDHRKICVIDGISGFTGGINLADEYVNEREKFGHWKDTSIFIRGEAVWSLTVMFLSMWEYVSGEKEDYSLYKPKDGYFDDINSAGVVQPFSDSPFDDEAVGETVYINLLAKAHDYVYITTPYLIVGNELLSALSNAVKSGVDIRIITPHIADKKMVHATTRSYYKQLIEVGVRIYEYTPGFIHAKTFVADDIYSIVGTINLDYRSLYLHFECATWLYKTESVMSVKEDFFRTLQDSTEYTLEMCRNQSFFGRVYAAILRVFAPLM